MSLKANLLDLGLHRLFGRQKAGFPYKINWVRPSEWPNISNLISPTDDKIVAIYMVPTATTDLNGVPVAFTCTTSTGTYTVNWGDGTSSVVASGVKAEKLYSPTNGTLTSTSYGYKCAIITVTANTGVLLTTNFASTYTGLNAASLNNWLDIDMRCPSMTSIAGVTGNRIQQFRLRKSAITTAIQFFFNCQSLESIPEFNTAVLTNVSSMFSNCRKLQLIPAIDISQATNVGAMFSACYSLLTCPYLNTSSAIIAASMFSNCYSLLEIPVLNFSSVTDSTGLNQMFYNCYSLRSIALFETSNIKSMSSMFSGCAALSEVPLFNTSSCTNMSSMFQDCTALRTVPLFNTAIVTNITGMFSGCRGLESIPLFNTSAVTDASGVFLQCGALATIPALNFSSVVTFATPFPTSNNTMQSCKITSLPPINVSFSNITNLGKNALEEIFSNLPNVNPSSRTITVTGCKGATASNKSFAISQGWTVVG